MKSINVISACILYFTVQISYAENIQNSIVPQNFNQLAIQCAPTVHPATMQAIARVESRFNPYAIGVVGGALRRQPQSYAEAVAAAKQLHAQGRNFSMGLVQVNKKNLSRYGLTYETVFNPCANLSAGSKILADCFKRAEGGRITQTALHKALSCYYSGNFRFGFTRDFRGQPSYVQKVVNAAAENSDTAVLRVPAIDRRVAVVPPSAKQRRTQTAGLQAAVVRTQTVTADTAAPAAVQAARVYQQWDAFQEF